MKMGLSCAEIHFAAIDVAKIDLDTKQSVVGCDSFWFFGVEQETKFDRGIVKGTKQLFGGFIRRHYILLTYQLML